MGDRIRVKKVGSVPFIIKIAPVILAVVFFIVGYANNSIYNKNKEYFVEIDATITKIEVVKTTDYNMDEETTKIEHIVFVDYLVDGVEYNNIEYSEYKANMKEGDVIKVYYDSRNPEDIYPTTNKSPLLMIIAIGIMVIYLIIVVAASVISKKAIAEILQNGECHRVKIDGLVNGTLVDANSLKEEFKPKHVRIKVLYNDTPYFSDIIKYTKEIRKGDEINLYLDSAMANKNRRSRVAKFRKTTNKVSNYYLDLNSISKG